jgi:hypothetical protein
LQGVTSGWSDEIGGILGFEHEREKNAKAYKDNPLLYTIADAAASILPVGSIAKKLTGIKAATGPIAAAALGALAGAGYGEDVKGKLLGATLGGGLGLGLHNVAGKAKGVLAKDTENIFKGTAESLKQDAANTNLLIDSLAKDLEISPSLLKDTLAGELKPGAFKSLDEQINMVDAAIANRKKTVGQRRFNPAYAASAMTSLSEAAKPLVSAGKNLFTGKLKGSDVEKAIDSVTKIAGGDIFEAGRAFLTGKTAADDVLSKYKDSLLKPMSKAELQELSFVPEFKRPQITKRILDVINAKRDAFTYVNPLAKEKYDAIKPNLATIVEIPKEFAGELSQAEIAARAAALDKLSKTYGVDMDVLESTLAGTPMISKSKRAPGPDAASTDVMVRSSEAPDLSPEEYVIAQLDPLVGSKIFADELQAARTSSPEYWKNLLGRKDVDRGTIKEAIAGAAPLAGLASGNPLLTVMGALNIPRALKAGKKAILGETPMDKMVSEFQNVQDIGKLKKMVKNTPLDTVKGLKAGKERGDKPFMYNDKIKTPAKNLARAIEQGKMYIMKQDAVMDPAIEKMVKEAYPTVTMAEIAIKKILDEAPGKSAEIADKILGLPLDMMQRFLVGTIMGIAGNNDALR